MGRSRQELYPGLSAACLAMPLATGDSTHRRRTRADEEGCRRIGVLEQCAISCQSPSCFSLAPTLNVTFGGIFSQECDLQFGLSILTIARVNVIEIDGVSVNGQILSLDAAIATRFL